MSATSSFSATAARTALAGACLLALSLHPTVTPLAQAAPVDFAFEGAGNVVVFDATTGSGGWVGSIDEVLAPGSAGPARSYVSVVTFTFDAAANALSGAFEFTDATDLSSRFFGSVSGAFSNPLDVLDVGGQWSLDYALAGGSGAFATVSGFGLAFLTYDLASMAFNNYSEQGLFALEVPAPATLPLVAAGLALLAFGSRRSPRLP